MLRMKCHCGKVQKAILCGTLHPSNSTSQKVDIGQFLSCSQTCEKVLGCGIHTCNRECHTDECGDCVTVRDKVCYCGKVKRSSLCGNLEQAQAKKLCFAVQEDTDPWQGEFSCGQPSFWKYRCGKHTEAETNGLLCHPHSSSQPLVCTRSPSLVSTCACGKTPLYDLDSKSRKCCRDTIPSCGKSCDKVRSGCGHACCAICHEGACGECQEMVTLVCRCGNEKSTIRCHDFQTQGEAELLCEKPCKALRNCGRHECGRKVSCCRYCLLSVLA